MTWMGVHGVDAPCSPSAGGLRAWRRSGPDGLPGYQPAGDNNRVPPGGGRCSFADPSPAEIVVANRQ